MNEKQIKRLKKILMAKLGLTKDALATNETKRRAFKMMLKKYRKEMGFK